MTSKDIKREDWNGRWSRRPAGQGFIWFYIVWATCSLSQSVIAGLHHQNRMIPEFSGESCTAHREHLYIYRVQVLRLPSKT